MYDLTRFPQIASELDDFERVCSVTVALKISDDSCKMDEYEKSVFMKLYDALEDKSNSFFDESVPGTIDTGRTQPSAQVYSSVKKLREAAMDYISRPKMKAFKAQIRKRLS